MAHFPHHWWRNRPLIFAHRGASTLAPENTMVAFLKAIEIGADGIELDVRLSLDGVPVVIHNANVDNTTDGHGSVYDFSLREIQSLDAGSWFNSSFSKLAIPTLEDVLDTLGRKTLINIELKGQGGKDPLLAEKDLDIVNRMALSESVWFSSFDMHLLLRTRKYLPEVPNGFLFATRSPNHNKKLDPSIIEAVHPHFHVISKKYVSRMHNEGFRVAAWTIDDLNTARKCFEADVDVLISNDPGKILSELC